MKLEETPKPRVSASDWLDAIEASVQTARSALLHPSLEQLAVCQSELESIVRWLEEFCEHAGQSRGSSSPSVAPRLRLLRKRVVLVQTMIRQAAAFYQGIEQTDTQFVLGYSPGGLERAL